MSLSLRPSGSRFAPPGRAKAPDPFVGASAPSPAPGPLTVGSSDSVPRLKVYQGAGCDVVVVDADFGPTIVEHAWSDPDDARLTRRKRCLTPAKGCPLCADGGFGKPKAFRPLTVVDYSANAAVDPRRIMAVDTVGVLKFLQDQHTVLGTLAGLKLRLTRAAGDQTTLGIPKDMGEVALSEIRGAVPIDWKRQFPPVTAARLRKRHGIEVPVGSPEDVASELEEGTDVE